MKLDRKYLEACVIDDSPAFDLDEIDELLQNQEDAEIWRNFEEFWDKFFSKKIHTKSEWDLAINKSSSWSCCAVGSKLYPNLGYYAAFISLKISYSVPFKYKNLGYNFTYYIQSRRLNEAKKMYDEIQNSDLGDIIEIN